MTKRAKKERRRRQREKTERKFRQAAKAAKKFYDEHRNLFNAGYLITKVVIPLIGDHGIEKKR